MLSQFFSSPTAYIGGGFSPPPCSIHGLVYTVPVAAPPSSGSVPFSQLTSTSLILSWLRILSPLWDKLAPPFFFFSLSPRLAPFFFFSGNPRRFPSLSDRCSGPCPASKVVEPALSAFFFLHAVSPHQCRVPGFPICLSTSFREFWIVFSSSRIAADFFFCPPDIQGLSHAPPQRPGNLFPSLHTAPDFSSPGEITTPPGALLFFSLRDTLTPLCFFPGHFCVSTRPQNRDTFSFFSFPYECFHPIDTSALRDFSWPERSLPPAAPASQRRKGPGCAIPLPLANLSPS